jgi:ribosome biogenesis GTPase / thiamine phosphate phosphatase
MKSGIVILSTGANHTVESDDMHYNCSIRGKLRLKGYRSTNPIAVGDVVDFEHDDSNVGAITKIHERKNCIIRKSINLSKESHIIASNIDQAVFVFTLRNPETTTVFLDRFLTAAESYSIPVVIIFNKTDIYKEEEFDDVASVMATYAHIGYQIIDTSVLRGRNLDKVKEVLAGKKTVLAGHSGVGKSSIINAIAPGFNLKTAIISEAHSSGKHTTTFARMIKLPFGGYIIDTPGIRGFGLIHLKREEIYHYFREIFEMSHKCKYHNCTHINEPDCAVKDAVDEGEIAWTRYKSYLNIVLDDDDKHRIKEV